MPAFDEPDVIKAAKPALGGYLGLAELPLRLGVMCTIGALRFTPFLARFRREFPGLHLRVTEGTAPRLKDLLAGGGLDLAVMAQPEPFEPALRASALYRERFVVAVPPGHALARQRALPLAALAGADYVDRVSCEYSDRIDRLMAAAGVAVKVVFASDREDWVQMMIVAGAGIACMPEFSPLLPGLGIRPIVDPEIVREISLVAPRDRVSPPAAATFAGAITRYDWSL